MDFGNALRKSFADDANNFINRVFKRMRVTFLGCEGAELTGENANVGVVDVTVVNVGGVVAVLLFARRAGHDSERVKIV